MMNSKLPKELTLQLPQIQRILHLRPPIIQQLIARSKLQRVQIRMTNHQVSLLQASQAELKPSRRRRRMSHTQQTSLDKLQPVQARMTAQQQLQLQLRLTLLKLTRRSRKMLHTQQTTLNKLQPVRTTIQHPLHLQIRLMLKPHLKEDQRTQSNPTMIRTHSVLQKSQLQVIRRRMLILRNLTPTPLSINQLNIHTQSPPTHRHQILIQRTRHILHHQPTKVRPRPVLSPRIPTTNCITVIRCRSRISRSRNKSAMTIARPNSKNNLTKKI